MVSSKQARLFALLASVSAIGFSSNVAFAQASPASAPQAANSDSAPIVVTAQRRSEKQVDVPITITALGNQALATANVQQLSDITRLTPALRFDNAGGWFQPTIRGVGTPVATSGGGSNVGIYIDGFYSPNPTVADFQLMNVQSIAVLKGPQGTLFGHNTTGGAIQVSTADPSTTTAMSGKISFGRFDALKMQAYATTGLSSNVAFDIEGMYSSGHGYLTNIINNERVGDYRDWSVRAGLKAQLGSNVSVLIRYQHSHTDDPTPALTASYYNASFGGGQPWFAAPGQYTYSPNQIASTGTQFIRNDSDVVQGTIKADLGFANLTSYTQYRADKTNMDLTLSYDGNAIFEIGLPIADKTWSQEFLLTSKPGPALQWTAGLFGFGNKDIWTVDSDNAYPTRVQIGGSGVNTESYAGFLDATYAITPQLFLTAGARYSHDLVNDAYWLGFLPPTYALAATNVPSISSNHFTPRAVLRFKPDAKSSVYASFTEGYKAAIIDVGGSCQDGVSYFGNPPYTCNPIKPEKIDSYEVGYKYDQGPLTFDASAFYYNYRNLQVSAYLSGTAYILNAASSHIYGIDAQLTARLDEHFSISAAGAWTHARYVNFTNAPVYTYCGITCTSPGTTFTTPAAIILNNVPMQRAPEFTGNITARYTQQLAGGKLALSGNLQYTSKLYFGPSGTQFPQGAYATLSARAAWTDPSMRYTLAVFGDNLTNKRYLTEVQASSYGIGANWSKPITYGVEFGTKF